MSFTLACSLWHFPSFSIKTKTCCQRGNTQNNYLLTTNKDRPWILASYNLIQTSLRRQGVLCLAVMENESMLMLELIHYRVFFCLVIISHSLFFLSSHRTCRQCMALLIILKQSDLRPPHTHTRFYLSQWEYVSMIVNCSLSLCVSPVIDCDCKPRLSLDVNWDCLPPPHKILKDRSV